MAETLSLSKWRQRRKMTQAELAALAGKHRGSAVYQSMISKWERNGASLTTRKMFERLTKGAVPHDHPSWFRSQPQRAAKRASARPGRR